MTSHRSGIAGGIAPTAVPATQARDSSHLPAIDGSMMVKPVALLAGRAKLLTKPLPHRNNNSRFTPISRHVAHYRPLHLISCRH